MKFGSVFIVLVLLPSIPFGARFGIKNPKTKRNLGIGGSLLHVGFEGLNVAFTVKDYIKAFNDTLHEVPQEDLRNAMASLGKEQIVMAQFRKTKLVERDQKQVAIYCMFALDVLLCVAIIFTPFMVKKLKNHH